jgi:hypothetical protein
MMAKSFGRNISVEGQSEVGAKFFEEHGEWARGVDMHAIGGVGGGVV